MRNKTTVVSHVQSNLYYLGGCWYVKKIINKMRIKTAFASHVVELWLDAL